ncbi:MAG: hypothetical protein RSE00_01725 [Clostridia bacterium]
MVINDNVRDALIKWIEFIYPSIIKVISHINLENAFLEYQIKKAKKCGRRNNTMS